MIKMITFRVRIGDSRIFSSSYWLTMPPEFNTEFQQWMEESIGSDFSTINEYKNVRTSDRRGAGNRGGWERKPVIMNFDFHKDEAAILFKMKWHDSILD